MAEANYDLVCIGGGGAAILAAIHAAASGKKVAILTKDYPGSGNTRLAVGMTACPGILPGDSREIFIDDLMRSGEGISEISFVESLSREAPAAISAVEVLGPIFRRNKEGLVTAEVVDLVGGHSTARSVFNHGGGAAIGACFGASLNRFGVTVHSKTAALELVVFNNRVQGLLALDLTNRRFIAFRSPNVLIATGGCSALYYPHTTNCRGSVGDGLTLALKAGVFLWDMEQIQAIPFGLTRPPSMIGALCGEPSTAGPAGRLFDQFGKVILNGGINKMNRAEVTRVMMSALETFENCNSEELLLDLKPNLKLPDGEKIYNRVRHSGIFNIVKQAYGREAFQWREPWPVLPTFHYQMGGIMVNETGETAIKGLYAAGEVRGGLHGGNRLGSVALSEIYTSGREIGKMISSLDPVTQFNIKSSSFEDMLDEKRGEWEKILFSEGDNSPQKLRTEVENCMWRSAGPLRDEKNLLSALEEIAMIEEKSFSLSINPETIANRQLLDAVELRLMLPAARAVVLSALERQESRGAHLRRDYPARDDRRYRCHTYVCKDENGNLKSGLMPLNYSN